jgi:hypothetical protein
MCEYSLEHIAFRPAKLDDKLVTTRFPHSLTSGFALFEDPSVAVCLLAGTELAFEKEVERRHPLAWLFPRLRQTGAKVARFRQVNVDKHWAHHDALEFPDGNIVLLTSLCLGQRATVLQLPVDAELKTTTAPSRQADPVYVG